MSFERVTKKPLGKGVVSEKKAYPKLDENLAKRALYNLKFVEIKGQPSLETKPPRPRQHEREAALRPSPLDAISKAMTDAYTLTYKDWVNRYYHSALRPSLLASLDDMQKEQAWQTFTSAAEDECSAIVAAFTNDCRGRFTHEPRTQCDEMRRFISHVRNFEARTSQRLNAIHTLSTAFTTRTGNHRGVAFSLKWALSKLNEAFEATAGGEVDIYIGLQSSLSQSLQSTLFISTAADDAAALQYHEAVYCAALLASTFDKLRCTRFSPANVAVKVITNAVVSNIALKTLDFEIGPSPSPGLVENIGALTLLKSDGRVGELVALAESWLERAREWIVFGERLLQEFNSLAALSSDKGCKDALTGELQAAFNEQGAALAQVLTVYALYQADLAGRPAATALHPPSTSSKAPLPFGPEFQMLIIDVITSECQTSWSTESPSQRYLRLVNAVYVFEDIASDFGEMVKVLRGRVVADGGRFLSDLHNDLIQDAFDRQRTEVLLSKLRIGPQNEQSASPPSAEGVEPWEWEEAQYSIFIQHFAKHILPSSIGGAQLYRDRTWISNALPCLRYLSSITGAFIGIHPELLIGEAANFDDETNLFHYGNWLNTEDAASSAPLPDVFEHRMRECEATVGGLGWRIKWLAGWSTMCCELRKENTDVTFRCSFYQHEIFNLIARGNTWSRDAILSHIKLEPEQSAELLDELVSDSKGLIVCKSYRGQRHYSLAAGYKSERPMSFARPKFSDSI